MMYINQGTAEFQGAKQMHYECVRYVIMKKLLGAKFVESHPLGHKQNIRQVTEIEPSVFAFMKDNSNLENLLVGTPDVLEGLKDNFTSGKEIESIKKLLNYDSFIGKKSKSAFFLYNAYKLADNLGLSTCVYCNRMYTHTVINRTECITRPSFDHWFPKSKFPLLVLSFYNLIPSCTICNTGIKGIGAYALSSNFHPYIKLSEPDHQLKVRFSFTLESHTEAKCKILSYNDFSLRNVKAMKLEEMYNCHSEEVRELIYLKKAHSQSYLDSLRCLLAVPVSEEELYRIAFGVYLEDTHLGKRPLSKLKKDILQELGIIK